MKEEIWTKSSCDSKESLLVTCPKCQKSKLGFIKFAEEITESGKDLEKHGYPYGIEHHFIGLMKCSSSRCNQIITISGLVDKDIEHSGQDEYGNYFEKHFDSYKPLLFSPNIRYFRVTSDIPEEIKITIDLAFHHFFYDKNASANKIRTALELILNDIKAPKKKWNNSKTKLVKFNNLHQRLENFKKTKKNISILMLANKYIGNDGSHIGNVNNVDLISAFDNLEEIVEQIYIKNRKKLISKAELYIEKRKSK